jgi:Flp pilus assembly protein TadD
VDVAFDLRIKLAPGTGGRIFASFGEDLEGGITAIMKEAVEIETARWPASDGSMPAGFVNGLLDELLPDLNRAGLIVTAQRAAVWELRGEAPPVEVSAAPVRKIIFVGVDGADWQVIDPLIDEGRLPNFKKLVEGGATGPLRSIEPLLSPLVWTTMATGKLPEEHGILNFTVADPATGKKVPISRLYRKVDAFWNMLSDHARTVDIIGWLATFPAETVNGVIVTDRVGYLAFADRTAPASGTIHPAERSAAISAYVVPSESVSYEDFESFIHIDRAAFTASRALDFDPKNRLNNMIMLYATTQTFRGIANHLLVADKPDFLGVYFELVDATKHLFMQYAPPRRPEVDRTEYATYKDAVRRAYELQDEIIGELIDQLGENTVLIVASDHGFKSGVARPKAGPEIWGGNAAFWHRLDGIICFYGSGIRRGHRIENASILDIAPTFLSLQGLPRALDMPGKVLSSVFDDELVSSLNTQRVATLQREREIDEAARKTGDPATDEILAKLEVLGYIASDNPDAYNNLGQRLQDAGKYEEAIVEFNKALAINPNFSAALNNVGVCYGRLKRYGDAEASFVKALEINPRDHYAMNNLAIMFLELRQFDKARQYGEKSVATEPNYANGHLTLGSIYATMGEFDSAEREFTKTLELDPGNRSATANLQRVRAEKAN